MNVKAIAPLLFSIAMMMPINATGQPNLPLILTHTFDYKPITPTSINPYDLKPGCPNRDCIQSIDYPAFRTIDKSKYMKGQDQVLVVQYNGITKAYPKKIMNFREIVNDQFGESPVLVTYCPLAYTGVAFLSQIEGETVRFGISGLLYNSDLVMYDRSTNQLWSQVLGEIVVGENIGLKMEQIQVQHMSWSDLVLSYPNALVLVPEMIDTNRMKKYPSGSPYGDYDTNEKLLYPVVKENRQLKRKTLVYGTIVDGQPIAITEDSLKNSETRSLVVEDINIKIHEDGRVVATEINSDAPVLLLRAFWFSWYAFYPETRILTK